MKSIFGGMKRKRAIEEPQPSIKKTANGLKKILDEDKDTSVTNIQAILKQQKKEDGKLRDQARAALAKAAKIRDLQHYNKLILNMGNTRGMYGYAITAFNELLENALQPNEYTFSNILNACARASEVEVALEYWNRMDEFNIVKDEIHYTILMKVYCNSGMLKEAIDLLDTMKSNGVYPNIRTYQTLIRECMHNSDEVLAEKVYNMLNDDNIDVSITILEHMCKLKVNLLKLKDAEKFYHLLLENEKKNSVVGNDVASLAVLHAKIHLSLGYILRNDLKKGRKYLSKAKESLLTCKDIYKKESSEEVVSLNTNNNNRKDQRSNNNNNTNNTTDTKKKSRQAFEKDQDFTTAQYLQSQIRESENDILRLEKYFAKLATLQNVEVDDLESDLKLSTNQWKATGTLENGGLTEAHRVYRLTGKALNWQKIFRNENPMRIEVGSGIGEWICERARKSPNVNWIAIEMSPERVFQIWSRMQLLHITNLVIIQGDAVVALQDYFSRKSIEQIYVNYPEPPVWARWKYRLLRTEFFEAAQRVLTKPVMPELEVDDHVGDQGKGFLTIVTDDGGYVWTLSKELNTEGGRSGHLFSSMLPNNDLFTTTLPLQYGNSYFDRFFQEGQKKRRYYFKLARVKQQK